MIEQSLPLGQQSAELEESREMQLEFDGQRMLEGRFESISAQEMSLASNRGANATVLRPSIRSSRKSISNLERSMSLEDMNLRKDTKHSRPLRVVTRPGEDEMIRCRIRKTDKRKVRERK